MRNLSNFSICRKIISVLILFNAQYTSAQETIYALCKAKLDTLLVYDKLINLQKPSNRDREANSIVWNSYKNLLPENKGVASKSIKYKFIGKSLNKIFSTTYMNSITPSIIENNESYQLANILHSVPIFMVNPEADRYRLYFNSANVLSHVLNAGGEANVAVIQSKISTVLKNSFNSRRNFDLFFGQFENRLGQLCYKISNGQPVDGNEWNPIMEIWRLYYNHVSFQTDYSKYRVTKSFYGLLVSNSNNVSISQTGELETQVKLNYNYLALAGFNSQYDFEWSKAKSGYMDSKNFEVYMLDEEEYPIVEIGLPTMDKIKAVWSSVANNICSVIYPDNQTSFNMNADGTVDFSAYFGPLASDFLEVGALPTNSLIKDITNIAYQPTELGSVKGVKRYNMKLILNKERIKVLQEANRFAGEFTEEVSIILGLGSDLKDKAEFSKNYSFNIKIDLKPYPVLSQESIDLSQWKRYGKRYEYRVPVKFSIVKSNAGASLNNIHLSNIRFNDTLATKLVTFRSNNFCRIEGTDVFSDTLVIQTKNGAILEDDRIQDLVCSVDFREGSMNNSKAMHIHVILPRIASNAPDLKDISNDLATALLKDLNIARLDSSFKISFNEKSYPIAFVLARIKDVDYENSSLLNLDGIIFKKNEVISQIGDYLVERKVLSSLPVTSNKKGVYILDGYKSVQ